MAFKKILSLTLLMIIISSLFSVVWNIGNYNLIKVKELPVTTTPILPGINTDYELEHLVTENIKISADDGMEYVEFYLTWKKNNKVVSRFPSTDYISNSERYSYNNYKYYSTKSKMWILSYYLKTPDDFTGIEKQSGIFFFSEDGKTLIKQIELQNHISNQLIFSDSLRNVPNKDYTFTDAEYLFSYPYLISVYGDIIYTIPNNLEIEYVEFSEDQQYFRYYSQGNYFNFIIDKIKLIYQGNDSILDTFVSSKDEEWCANIDRFNGRFTIYKMDVKTRKPIETFQPHITNIKGIPFTRQNIYNSNGELESNYYDIKIRFEDGTNNLIITTDNKWESTVEILYGN